jgi:hypothetical protein
MENHEEEVLNPYSEDEETKVNGGQNQQKTYLLT